MKNFRLKKFYQLSLVSVFVLLAMLFAVKAQYNPNAISMVKGEHTTVQSPATSTESTDETTTPTEESTNSNDQAFTGTPADSHPTAKASDVVALITKTDPTTVVAPVTNDAPAVAVVDTPVALVTPTPPVVPVVPPVTPVTPPVTVTNLISNPSVETAVNNLPTGWAGDGYGTNDRVFSYENTGRNGGHSVKTAITTITGIGDAKWFFAPVSITAGSSYKYNNWYKSNVDTQINVMVNFADGTTQYYYLVAAPMSADWTQVSGTFTMPANATTATVFQALTTVGTLEQDDFSFTAYQPTSFARALISLTFDDGWSSIYTNGLSLLNTYGLVSTQYLLTSTIDYPDYMTVAMMQAFKDSGSEIAAHTVNHCDLTGVQSDDTAVCPTPISASQVQSELAGSKTSLETWFGAPVTDFATPYGAYNADVIAAIKAAGFESHRSTDVGYNSLDSFNPYNIKVQNIVSTTTVADVEAWVNESITNKTWLVIVFHQVDANPSDPAYAVTPANLDLELAYIKQTGVTVATVSQALAEIAPQVAALPVVTP